jgi:membrane associated rhomboid family serine protease
VRQARTIFGGEVVTGRPMATIAIIAVCAAAFAAQRADPGLTDSWAFGPAIGWSEPWRVLTSAFLHGGMAHLVLNMLALWFMGSYVEPLLGRLRFIVVYLLSAVGGSVGVLLLASAPTTGAVLGQAGVYDSWFSGYVGASGAVFGLFGTVLVLNRHLGRDSSGMYLTIGINAVYGFIAPNVAWQAHLGGLVTGAVAAGVLAWCAAPERRRLVWPLLLGLLSVLVLLAALKYAGVPDGYR